MTSTSIGMVGSILVVGGGVGGIQASIDLAESGYKVYLLESSPSIGGVMARLDKTFPTNDCSMCILSPKLVYCGRHHNIEILTYSSVEEVLGDEGNFTVIIRQKPRYVDGEKCTGCGVCSQHCPVDAIDTFNEGLNDRNAIYIDYPQAVPLTYVIDKEKCIGCGLCENLCPPQAINFLDTEKKIKINVGAIILSPGVGEFDATIKSEYGYGRYPNVITSLEFERILSASGPFSGRIQRLSDGDVPQKIAFIQCVGSRDVKCENDYCSSVCCMYATKEAVIAKEHMNQIEPTIFYIDMRAYGKDFDKYIERAKNEYYVRFIRCRVSDVQENNENKNLILSYENDYGRLIKEEYDLVVLSTGFKPSEEIKTLSKKIGIKLNQFNFCETNAFEPLQTSKPGVFVCGSFSSPKDIPETVTQASAAACKAEILLSSKRGSLVKEKKYPEELSVRAQPPRIGVFICHCGINIGGIVDVPKVAKYTETLSDVVYVGENLYTCSSDTQQIIKEKIQEHKLNRVVVASCTPRTHEPLFQDTIREAGLNRYLFVMANIRDQNSWVHMHEPEAATEKAKDLIRIAVAKAKRLEPLKRISINVTPRALVIGGGLSGMTAATALADQSFEVFLVEKKEQLGGFLKNIYHTITGDDTKTYLEELICRVKSNDLIHTFLGANIEEIKGYVGNFVTTLDTNKEKKEVDHGVIIVATGGEEYQPKEYLFGQDRRVITQSMLEQYSEDRLSDINSVVMIQCVGSRDDEHPYCSRVCCNQAIKNAIKIKEINKEIEVFVLYRDVRTYGLNETFYTKARNLGVIFVRYDDKPDIVKREDGSLYASVKEQNIGELISIDADIIVLSSGIVPPKSNNILAQMLKVPLNEDGFFLEAHAKLRPVEFATDGIFMCGLAHSPKSIEESISQAYAAASKAAVILSKEYIEAEGIVAFVDSNRCIACGNCEVVCEYNAIRVTGGYAEVNPLLCKGCGTCSVECPAQAIKMHYFTDDQISSMIKAALESLSYEERPKAIAFFCNWCAYAGADLAGISRFQYPPTARVIRVMCTGRVNEKHILQAFLLGADGVLIGGCHPGDCHYMSGNLKAEKRIKKLSKWLEEVGLEPKRLRLEWISAGEGGKLARVMNEFTDQLKDFGPNPLIHLVKSDD